MNEEESSDSSAHAFVDNSPTSAALPAAGNTLRRAAMRAAIWTGAGFGASQVMRLASNIILARLLTPDIFGVMALAQIFIQGLTMFSDVGVGPSVIRARRLTTEFLNTAWTIQFARGCVLCLASIGLGIPVAQFYKIPELAWLIPLMGFSAVISGARPMSVYTQNKQLALGRLTIISLVAQACSLSAVIGVAWFTRNAWAFVIGGISYSLIDLAGSYWLLPSTRHQFTWHKDSVKALTSFGKWVFVSTLLAFVGGQLDRLMLGKMVSLQLLGVYSIAIGLASLPKNVLLRVATTVLLPTYSNGFNGNGAHFARRVLLARGYVLAVGVITIATLVTASPLLFQWLYDSRYGGACWMTQLLAIYIWFWILQASVVQALLALGDSRSMSISNFVNTVTTILGCLLGFHVARMPGFIVGLSFSSLLGYAVVHISLAVHGIRLLHQDVLYTGMAILLITTAMIIGWATSRIWAAHIAMVTPNILLAVTAVVVCRHVLKPLRADKK